MSASDAEHNGSSSRMDESSDVAEPAAAAAAEARPAASAATAAVPAAIAAATAADDEGGAMATEGAAVTDEGDDSASAESQRVLEEYRVWKKNAPFLYDCVVSHALEWPSLTVQWLPDRAVHDGKEAKDRYTVQRLLLGTHTSAAVVDSAAAASSNGAAVAAVAPQNYLLIAEVRLPRADGSSSMANGSAANNGDVQIKGSSSDLDGGGGGSSGNGIYGRSQGRIEIVQRIPHAGEVNRARYAPFNPDLIATKSPSSVVCVFDRSKHSSRPIEMSSLGSLVGGSGSGSSGAVQARPDLLLEGHTEEGYGLQWNPHAGERGSILSGSNDGLICMWNVEQAAQERKKTGTGSSGGAISAATPTLSALRTFRAHTDVVEDVAWSHFQPSVFASCGDDARLLLWDTRTGGGTGSGSGSSGAAAGGGTQPVAALNDPTKARSAQAAANARRNVDGARSAGASHHTGNINCVGFNHFSEHVLASGGSDGVVLLWDLRSLSSPLHALRAQNEHFHASSTSGSSADGVAASAPLHFFNLQWSPFSADLLLATDATRRAYIWDVSRIGDEDEGQSNGGADDEDEESDGLPRSLTFVHGGMTDRIGDACWNANEGDEWMVASVADDNVLQIWQVSESVYGNDDDEAPAR